MESDLILGRNFYPEFKFSATRSSGPGGQNVNKVSTKVELRFNIQSTELLTPEEKQIIFSKLGNKITKEGEIVLVSQAERSQLANKEKVTERFYSLLIKALTPTKKRKPTKPSKQAKMRRLDTKRLVSEKKTQRRNVDF
jgi:ribosome-associated protein